jgi:nucleoside-diphosphate-sugar epimerase
MTKSAEHACRVVLLTGATGVVGQALLRRLLGVEDIQALCLVYRSPVREEGVRSVRGDITKPRLGIPSPVYRELIASVDAVVHAAATVDFSCPDDFLSAMNVEGVRRILDFASDADVPLYHVSTAYADRQEDELSDSIGARYAKSKKQGDELVRSSGLPQTIIRPSAIIGNSLTGEVASFQAAYLVAEKFLRGHLTVFPCKPDARADLIPCDIVADSIAALLERQATGGEYWVTNGADALTVHDSLKIIAEFSELTGHPRPMPRFVSGKATTRLLDSLPRSTSSTRTKNSATWLSNYFGPYLLDSPLPSSRPRLVELGVEWLSSPAESFRTSLRHWGQVNGLLMSMATGSNHPGG